MIFAHKLEHFLHLILRRDHRLNLARNGSSTAHTRRSSPSHRSSRPELQLQQELINRGDTKTGQLKNLCSLTTISSYLGRTNKGLDVQNNFYLEIGNGNFPKEQASAGSSEGKEGFGGGLTQKGGQGH